MAFMLYVVGVGILALGGLGHLAAGISRVDLGNGIKFTVPAWLGGGALFLVLGHLLP
ncbi:MAG: hypothetical protein QOG31_1917 [Thermoplasmata archaeon]|jgi:hypothetical protein|nr:hypothetical protein [Thermoplasmata archaeon]